MGIRFYCPNGHKLNVKMFLAGKKGICPECNISVDIPLTSTRVSGKDSAPTAEDATAPSQPADANVPMAQPVVAGAQVPMAQPVGAGAEPTAVATGPTTPAGSGVAAPVSPPQGTLVSAVARPATPQTVMKDFIAEAPEAVWYVRPESGGQYGPAKGDTMRQWLEQGRVASDSLVWREDWTDWKPAAETFSKFSPASTPPSSPATGTVQSSPLVPATTGGPQPQCRFAAQDRTQGFKTDDPHALHPAGSRGAVPSPGADLGSNALGGISALPGNAEKDISALVSRAYRPRKILHSVAFQGLDSFFIPTQGDLISPWRLLFELGHDAGEGWIESGDAARWGLPADLLLKLFVSIAAVRAVAQMGLDLRLE